MENELKLLKNYLHQINRCCEDGYSGYYVDAVDLASSIQLIIQDALGEEYEDDSN